MRLKWEHGRVKRSASASASASSSSSTSAVPKPLTTPAIGPGRDAHSLSRIPQSFNQSAATVRLNVDPPLPVLSSHRNGADVFLLQHYFFTVSSLLSSTPDRSVNTYVSTILPLMLEHDCLLDTVLALSAVHLSSRFPNSFSIYGEKLKGDGMRGLIQRLDKCRDKWWDDGVLATIIMFGLLEVFDANASLWSRHLEGAGSLVAAYLERAATATPSAFESYAHYDNPTSRKLLDIYAYHEVLASISLRRAPRLPSSFLSARGPPGNRPQLQWSDTGNADLCGVLGVQEGSNDMAAVAGEEDSGQWSAFARQPQSKSVFLTAVDSLLSLVAELARVRSSCRTDSAETRLQTATIVERLRRWRCPGVGYSNETCNTAEAMRQAGILFYHLSFPEEPNGLHCETYAVARDIISRRVDEARHEKSTAAGTIVECLRVIPPSHSVVASHIWPLYMAGVATSDEEQRMFIRTRLDDMARVRGMKSIVQMRETLSQVWAGRIANFTGLNSGDNLGGLVLF